MAQYLLVKRYFCAVYDYAGKADLSNDRWNPKRKLGGGGVGGIHFHEITQLKAAGEKLSHQYLFLLSVCTKCDEW